MIKGEILASKVHDSEVVVGNEPMMGCQDARCTGRCSKLNPGSWRFHKVHKMFAYPRTPGECCVVSCKLLPILGHTSSMFFEADMNVPCCSCSHLVTTSWDCGASWDFNNNENARLVFAPHLLNAVLDDVCHLMMPFQSCQSQRSALPFQKKMVWRLIGEGRVPTWNHSTGPNKPWLESEKESGTRPLNST